MSPSRRALLASLPIVASGCSGLASDSTPTPRPDRDDDGLPDAADDYPDDPSMGVRKSRVSGTPTLEPGAFDAVALPASGPDRPHAIHYEVSVDGDGRVDCVVFDGEAYDAYQEGARDVPIVDTYSRTAVRDVTVTERLDEGEYVFAVDHTSLHTSPAPAAVTVDLLVEVAWIP